MLAIALALAASVSWGLGDFLGGLTSRRLHVLTVLVVQQVFGLAVALAWVLLAWEGFPGWTATSWAAAAGVCGCLGIGALCTICGRPVGTNENELQLQFIEGTDSPRIVMLHLHTRCYAAWELERSE